MNQIDNFADNKWWRWVVVLGLVLGSGTAPELRAQEVVGGPVAAAILRLPSKTLGGEQFWADEFIRDGWRIQRNAFTEHHRLLDSNDYRRAVGDYAACRAKFDELYVRDDSAPRSKKAVVLLHGLVRSRDCMQPLADYLAEEGGYQVVNVTYPSTRGTVREHAASLEKVLTNLEDVEEVHFVAHSLGNLVIRNWMQDYYRPEESEFELGRFVMLGPPNNGAQIARTFKDNQLFCLLTGKCGKQLAVGWDELSPELCVPPCEFGIIAGTAPISNPLITGVDDWIVGVEETKLAGAADFRVLPLHHGDIRSGEAVGTMTLHFLQHGCFESPAKRVPLQ